MTKIFANGRWYVTKYSTSMYEEHYTQRILFNAATLFPTYFCCKFKENIISNDYGGPNQADLVLIDKNYRYWYVVEVELDTDNFSHVVEQVKVFTSGTYNLTHVNYLVKRNDFLDADKIERLITTSQPQVVVLIPKVKPSWANTLSQYGCKFVVVEIFKSSDDYEVLRKNGDELRDENESLVTKLKYGHLKALEIESPANLDPDISILSIEYQGQLTKWRLTRWGNTYSLLPQGATPIEIKPGISLSIVKSSDGLLRFE